VITLPSITATCLCWHEVGPVQNDAVPRDGWEMAALAIGLGGAIR